MELVKSPLKVTHQNHFQEAIIIFTQKRLVEMQNVKRTIPRNGN